MSAHIVSLTDAVLGQNVRVLVSQGFNCFSWTRETADGSIEALWSTPDVASGTSRASSSGIPILFPFPGRLRGNQFVWRGRTYPLEAGDALGNAIHGFVHTRPWRLLDQSADRVTAEFQASVDDPTLLTRWPSDFLVQASYQLGESRLVFRFSATNTGSQDLPFGLGLHPYFRTGIYGQARHLDQLKVPVTKNWILEQMLPTGETETDPFGLAEAAALADLQLDHVFEHGSPADKDGRYRSALRGAQDHGMTLTYGDEYPFCVIYTPGHREAVCIEPYTCLPNSPEFIERVAGTGWRELSPGATFESQIEYHWA